MILGADDPEIGAFLTRWADSAEADAAAWEGSCGVPPSLPAPIELPSSVAECATRDFGCPEGETGVLCDGIHQCIAGEDERFCGPIAEGFTCHHFETLRWDQVCNGVPDCEFGEDERTCPALPLR